jgi:hypothetical protein
VAMLNLTFLQLHILDMLDLTFLTTPRSSYAESVILTMPRLRSGHGQYYVLDSSHAECDVFYHSTARNMLGSNVFDHITFQTC